MDSLKGKIALVTGSSRGIGRAIALALARDGADVAVNYFDREAEAEASEARDPAIRQAMRFDTGGCIGKRQVEKLVGEVGESPGGDRHPDQQCWDRSGTAH